MNLIDSHLAARVGRISLRNLPYENEMNEKME